ncbi:MULTISPECIES: Stp1/IreP family PP2C-type Ser/Thr phosphatase [unclassified Nodularia (in: cyanobacteria)]|uniref:Stp1/IreP family PP2C-type Ser/Thr phosphatase n=1 Tax=unclassified Nodularia (in: cyanobacteria) TaxID=2656917 RepID=UPI00187ED720|nr:MULTISPECIES: Stp1/IreP family PP2C-type Ser/Thr phosphatase [unclassified Nodularia (in: cyanobacteria)]MBE9201376.1 Stp1/IreP family PP2C-type Ser/Thr phosphatase [Nodularia sp. LEGE 06071]MCC2694637.1 Stp1/IreP family PP2C-type Ser/Thr phosphatase [Nodularia sp. LEGE 04288]
MKLNFTGSSDPGLIRSSNQDAFYIDPDGRFFIVADGMGGHAGGEQASRIATQEIQAFLVSHWDTAEPTPKLLENALWQANKAIIADQKQHPERADMGTTVVAVIFRSTDSPWCAHVGDSRLYRFRESQLEQVTEDHTWVARAIKLGDITEDEARNHPYRHILSRCLGREDLHQVDVQPLDVKLGDRLLLCSDGLTEELNKQNIADHLRNSAILETASLALIEAAKDQGGHDNITIVMVSVE